MAVRLAGGARFTIKVVDAVCVSTPLVPLTVRERAYGLALDVVFMVRVDAPEPVMVAGANPPLVIPPGNPDSLPTLKLTVPLKPVSGITVTVKLADCPGTTVLEGGPTAILKSGLDGVTVTIRVGGLGSEFPLPSMTVREAT